MPDLPPLPAERLPVVDFGLDLENWQERAVPARRGILVSAARLVEKKGLRFVPPALVALRARGVACHWRVVGDGPELPSLQAACAELGVADLTEFLGASDNARVRAELLAADVALLPCVYTAGGDRDGIPVFLVEAMALGVPVVTTPVAGIPELVRDGDTGFMATPGDSGSLADVLATVLADPGRAAAIAARGRDAARRKFDATLTAGQLIACIER
jgi:glycosyltransferase involved in cell wall biosynthesis